MPRLRRISLQDKDRERRGRRRNLAETKRMPRAKISKEDILDSAVDAADGAISKLNTLKHYLKLLHDRNSVIDIESIIADVQDISDSI